MQVVPGRPRRAEAYPVQLDLEHEDLLYNERDKRRSLPELKTDWDSQQWKLENPAPELEQHQLNEEQMLAFGVQVS